MNPETIAVLQLLAPTATVLIAFGGLMLSWRKAILAELSGVKTRLTKVERENRLLDEYAVQLRTDISAGKPPPPRPWPDDLKKITD